MTALQNPTSESSPIDAQWTPSTPWLVAISGLLGTAIAIGLVGVGFLSGQNDRAWFPTGDQNQALVGLLYYLHDAWRFPLFAAANLGPAGMNIIFTDSIPLLALPAKMWFSLTGQAVNYFGAWVLLCFALQAVAFNLLLREFVTTTLIAVLAATVIACTTPVLLMRYWMEHLALMGHFLVLFGLLLMVREGRDRTTPWRALGWWIVLLTAALWVHPYLLALTGAMFGTARVERLLRYRRVAAETIRTLLGVCWILSLMLVSGHIQLGGLPSPVAPETTYTMNLLAPLLAQGLSGLLPGRGHVDPTGHQAVEGFAYFGAGIWAALLIVMVLGMKRWLQFETPMPKRGRRTDDGQLSLVLLALLAMGFFIYALSPNVYALETLLISYPWPAPLDALARHFRVTSRFFWPALYLIYLAALLGLLAWLPRRLVAPALLLVAALQWLDTRPLQAHVKARSTETAPILTDARWRTLVPLHDELLLYPPMFCTADTKGMDLDFDLQLLAAHAQLHTNSLYAARWVPDCTREVGQDAYRVKLKPRRLIVFQNPPFSPGQLHRMSVPQTACRKFENGYACSLEWERLPEDLKTEWSAHPLDAVSAYDPGRELHLIAGSPDSNHLGAGWSLPEAWGTWSLGRKAQLELPLARPLKGKTLAEFEVNALLGKTFDSQRVKVFVNGYPLAEWFFTETDAGGWRRVELPAEVAEGTSRLTFEFRIARPRSPAEIGLSDGDLRPLGIALIHARVSDQQDQDPSRSD
ncbi:DUF6311 domain-containing protein [Thiocystis violacea]|uniref:DUF6311 domain-containing protein n=1 Tax=Thiocystis violacea TaxID=13725 RepID=UPI001904336E|nr:DUF6311 domain-containing protein [Thiocystis violacea]